MSINISGYTVFKLLHCSMLSSCSVPSSVTITAVWLYAALCRQVLCFNLSLIKSESMVCERDESGDEDVSVRPEAECPALGGGRSP